MQKEIKQNTPIIAHSDIFFQVIHYLNQLYTRLALTAPYINYRMELWYDAVEISFSASELLHPNLQKKMVWKKKI